MSRRCLVAMGVEASPACGCVGISPCPPRPITHTHRHANEWRPAGTRAKHGRLRLPFHKSPQLPTTIQDALGPCNVTRRKGFARIWTAIVGLRVQTPSRRTTRPSWHSFFFALTRDLRMADSFSRPTWALVWLGWTVPGAADLHPNDLRSIHNLRQRLLRSGGVATDATCGRDVHFLVQLRAWRGWVPADDLRGVLRLRSVDDVLWCASGGNAHQGNYRVCVNGHWVSSASEAAGWLVEAARHIAAVPLERRLAAWDRVLTTGFRSGCGGRVELRNRVCV